MHHEDKLSSMKQTAQRDGDWVVFCLSIGAFLVHYDKIIVLYFYPAAFYKF